MKLKIFNSQTFIKQMGGGKMLPRVSFNKAGCISFNKGACDLIGLKGGGKVTLAQDEEELENWYLFLDEENGFVVRIGYDSKGCLMNHKKLYERVIEGFKLSDGVTHNFKIAGQPTIIKGDKTKYWGLIAPVNI